MKGIDLNKLFELSEDKAELLEDELYRFSKILSSNYELNDLLFDIRRPKELKKNIIMDVFPRSSERFREVLSLLVDKDLIRNIFEVSKDFTALVAEKKNLRFDELVFSENPSDELLLKFKKITSEKVKFRIEIDPSILGGFIWKTMDGRVMDASIKGRLTQMKEEIAA